MTDISDKKICKKADHFREMREWFVCILSILINKLGMGMQKVGSE